METWKTIVDFENYEVSNLGNVRNKLTGKVLETYQSIKEAAIANNVKPQGICKACKGRCKSYKGFKWQYLT